MGTKLPPKEMSLYKRIDEILWKDWDPIGVNDSEQARDEYRGYLPHIFRLAVDGADPDQIARELMTAIDGMGLSINEDQNLTIATRIIEAKQGILD